MVTNTQRAAELLRNAAGFFREIGGQNKELTSQMNENAHVYEVVADMVEKDPDGHLDDPADNG